MSAKPFRRVSLLPLLVFAAPLFGQMAQLSVAPAPQIIAKAGSTAELKLSVKLLPGFHCNSNKPSDDYLIPLQLTWGKHALQTAEVVYPKPQMEKFAFSPTPISIYSGNFEIVTHFKVPANATPGESFLSGKLRYQACNDRMCFAPKTADVSVPVQITK